MTVEKRHISTRLGARMILALLLGLVIDGVGRAWSTNVWMTAEDLVRESNIVVGE